MVLLAWLAPGIHAADGVVLTEFMAKSVSGILDEDASREDWIEIYNAGATLVDLGGWALTDNASRLNKWLFPSTNIGPGQFMIVWASGKDRRIAGAPLHTNFKLDPNPGEFLALVRPDRSIASQYAPTFPPQVQDISYGLPVAATTNVLLASGAAARFLVPPDATLEPVWAAPTFDDSAWSNASTALGFAADSNPAPAWLLVADSLTEFSGIQGAGNWRYGYYNKTNDSVPGYQAADFVQFPNSGTAWSTSNYWTGTAWDYYGNNPPYTSIGTNTWHPNGVNYTNEHWVIRRWVAETNGSLRVDWWLAKQNVTCGNGVTGYIFHNGTQADAATIGSSDAVGVSRSVYLTNVQTGDFIDYVLSPLGTDGQFTDPCDGSYGRMWIYFNAELGGVIAGDVRTSMWNSNASLYVRLPFEVPDPSVLCGLMLRAHYDDGFVAYLNGIEVGRRSAPEGTTGGEVANSTNAWTATSAQGNHGWFYGYYNRSKDSNGTYDPATDFNLGDENWVFNGSQWVLGVEDPPVTMIGATTWQPNGTNSLAQHWAIRRWVSEISGVVTARVAFAKATVNGGGATLHLFLNGDERLARTISGNDTAGFVTNVVLAGIDPGDMLDFALDPLGTDGLPVDTGDLCTFGVTLIRAPSPALGWDSAATAEATGFQTFVGETLDVSAYRNFLLAGTNVLAVQGLNLSPSDPDFFLLPELLGVTSQVDTNQRVYFATPTPGSMNGSGTTNLGPVVVDVAHTPLEPRAPQAVTVTARAIQTFDAVSNLTLTYRVMFSNEVTVAMFDDGLHGDGSAGDSVFGGTIPANIAQAGQMIRYAVTATDTTGDKTRTPAYLATRSPQYFGLVVADSGVVSGLPVFHWFIQSPSSANNETGTRCSIYYNGQFLDNVHVNLHGQTTSGFAKKSHNFDLNPGEKLVWQTGAPDLSDFALLTTWADRSHMRNALAYDTYRMSGALCHFSFPVRVQQNGTFFSVANFTEQGNEDFLERLGLDPDGALYKMYNGLTQVAGNEKKTRKYEPAFDLQALLNGVTQGDFNTRLAYVYDHVNIPEVLCFLAGHGVNSDTDCCHKNHYFYRDSNGTGEWSVMPWDVDLSWGHLWTGTYLDDNIVTNGGVFIGTGNNNLFSVFYGDPALRQMWARRTRTLMNQLLQPPGTPAETDMFRGLVGSYERLLAPDAALDFAKWGSATNWPSRDLANEVARIKDIYLPGRRTWMFVNSLTNSNLLPLQQPAHMVIQIGAVEFNPASRDQAQEYVELINTNAIAVDISGWELTGGVRFKFIPGTVIPGNGRLYVSPDVKAFRARTVSPKAGERRYVVGPYSGQLSARGEALALLDLSGQTNSSLAYAGSPSPAQQFLRITELMYNPAPIPGVINDAQYLEYLELKNTSSTETLDLNGVKLVDGVVFDFAFGAITNLGPGQRVLVVRNVPAFEFRYGAGLLTAGVFTGTLDNGGERIRLLDAFNEEILDFSYDNQWYPITDGLGFSLVVVDEQAEPDAWGSKAQWRPSGSLQGSPGADDPSPPTFAPIVVNEVLTRTDVPQVDAVELHNPTTNDVDLGGWFITDNFALPTKYRIPPNTLIPVGSYLVFTETNFNPDGVGFSFSSAGERVYLFSGDATTNLTGYVHGFDFGAAENGVSFGRHLTSQGEEHFVAQRALTLGTNNAGPLVGPVAISEIMYHPIALTTNDPPASYIELLNITSTNVALRNLAEPTNTWRLRNAVDFDFPTNVTLAPGGTLLVVGFDPATNATALAAFRSRYGLSTNVLVLGPWHGDLANDSETIELKKPDLADTNGVPFVLVEEIRYSDASPWPTLADGLGASLRRVVAGDYGNDPTNWVAATPSPGTNCAKGQSPAIAAQPASRGATLGSTVTLSVGVSGDGPFNFQWQFNGATLPGATSNPLLLSNVQRVQSGEYRLLVMTPFGSVLSEPATLVVQAPVNITSQPPSQTVFPYNAVTFSVSATGDALAYQWRLDGTNLPGATNAAFVLSSVQPTDAGSYSVTISNVVSGVVSSAATLTVTLQPLITTQPQGRTVLSGSNVTISVTATSSTPLRYQWWFNTNTSLAVATNRLLLISNAQPVNAGTYTVWVADDFGSVTSAPAVLEVSVKPIILQQPAPTNQVLFTGSSISMTVSVAGTLPISYRWRKNGFTTLTNAILNENSSGYSIPSVQLTNAGFYDVAATNLQGAAAISSRVNVTVMNPLTNQTARTGTNVTFTFTASSYAPGTPPASYALKYQWWFNATNLLTGATNATLTLSNVQSAHEGTYTVVATNAVNAFASQMATLSLLAPPIITQQPISLSVLAGSTAEFAVTAEGTAPLSYQWRFNGTDLPGATASMLSLANAQLADAGAYTVVITNSEGSVTSQVATLTVLAPPIITQQPTNRALRAGQDASFTVQAGGGAPLSYQWWFNGTNQIDDATDPTLTLTNAQPTNSGTYHVVITNSFGVITSDWAALTVLVLPTITQQPADVTVAPGSSVNFFVTAEGTPPLSYQWQFENTDLPGATTPVLSINSVQASQAGDYRVIVSNAAGAVTSVVARLRVLLPLTITCPSNVTTFADTGRCYASDVLLGSANAGDNPDVTWVTNDAPAQFPIGTTTVTWTVSDLHGRTATCEQPVTVQDTEAPVISWAFTNLVLGAITNCQALMPDVTSTNHILSFDNCGSVTVTQSVPTGTILSLGTNLVVLGIFDGAGNVAFCTNEVVVADTNGPSLELLSDPSASSEPGICGATVSFLTAAMDDCDPNPQVVCSPESGSEFPVGMTPVRCVGTDASGNSSGLEFTVTVVDAEQPKITCPPNVIVTAGASQCYATGVVLGMPVATDNCGVASVTNDAPVQFPIGITSVTWTATDMNGNRATCQQTVTVLDNLPAIATQPQSLTNSPGTSAVFSVVADACTPLTYQWWFNATNLLAWAAEATLTLTNLQTTNAGDYHVVVTCAGGSITSAVATLVIENADTDGDGMPDLWEQAHDFDPASPLDAALDADADSLTNLDEYRAGTDPRDPESLLRVEILLAQPAPTGVVTIRFQGKAGRRYTLFYREKVDGGPWQVLAQWEALATDQFVTVDDVITVQPLQRFYRLLAIPQL